MTNGTTDQLRVLPDAPELGDDLPLRRRMTAQKKRSEGDALDRVAAFAGKTQGLAGRVTPEAVS